jgi:hypothetical protein
LNLDLLRDDRSLVSRIQVSGNDPLGRGDPVGDAGPDPDGHANPVLSITVGNV